MTIYAGKTDIPVKTKIRIIRGDLKGAIGEITHAFGYLGFYDHGAIAGAFIDNPEKYNITHPEINLYKGDFEIIK
ncbi:hypothetical protein ES703_120660 [subsurface metagenome]